MKNKFTNLSRHALHAALAVSSLMLVACSWAPVAARQSWTLANEYPATSLPGEADILFAELVAQRTNGQVTIVVSPDARLGYKSRDQLAAVANDKVTMANSFGGAIAEIDPVFALSSLPFVATNLAEARALFDGARPLYEAAFARHNQVLLFVTPWPASGLWARIPVTSVADVARLSIRTYDKTGVEVFSRLGAKAKLVSFTDVVPLLASGDINAVLSSGDGGAGRKLWEYLPSFTEIGYAVPLSFSTINRDRWNALSPAVRQQVLSAAKQTQEHVWLALEGRVEKNYKRMRDNGMTITSPIPQALREPLRAAGRSEAEAWKAQAGPDAARVLEQFRASAAASPK
jgi:TRAP-type C4-dicarboxylate transport system substrate-binding protein